MHDQNNISYRHIVVSVLEVEVKFKVHSSLVTKNKYFYFQVLQLNRQEVAIMRFQNGGNI